MSAWNLDAGPSIHAELVGREWVRMGHDLTVYSFHRSDFHGTTFVGEDEEYVVRCFGTQKGLDPRPILKSGFQFFVVQDLCMLPKDDLGKIFHHIRARSKTVNIIHDAELSDDPSFYQFEWDAVVCFDDRYRSFLSDVYPEPMIHVIPFPCRPVSRKDKVEARRSLGLPLDRRLLLVFGQHVKDDLKMLPAISRLGREYPITLLVVSRAGPNSIMAENIQVELRRESPTVERLYSYLHASDALLLHRETVKKAVVSSTAHQCLGAGCPIIAFDSPFFEYFDEEILKYRSAEEFEANLTEVLTDGEKVKRSLLAAEKYVKRNSASSIAERFIELFNRL
ncbi:MAG: hypothetical protein QXT81_02140 [Candidatus Bathyarchaeia archaeon]